MNYHNNSPRLTEMRLSDEEVEIIVKIRADKMRSKKVADLATEILERASDFTAWLVAHKREANMSNFYAYMNDVDFHFIPTKRQAFFEVIMTIRDQAFKGAENLV